MGTVNLPERVETIRVRISPTHDDTDFCGWAAQPGFRTVQGKIETVPTFVARMPLVLTVTGRTDTGVRTCRQVVHIDIPLDVWQAFAPRGAD